MPIDNETESGDTGGEEKPVSQQLAEERTDWAEDRTVLANERTFAGWMRTGLGAIGIALGLEAVFRSIDRTWAAKATATLFVLVAIGIFAIARYSARQTLERLSAHTAEPISGRRMDLIALVMGLAAVCVGTVLWLA